MSPRISIRLLATQSDQRLLALVKTGHERAFEAVVQRYQRPLLRYCRSLRLSDMRAEDVVQQGLLQAWLALANGTEVRELRPWLYRVVHNAAVSAMRGPAEAHAPLAEPVGALVIAPGESELERRIALRDALGEVAALPLMQRQAIFLSAVDGQSHDEVAYALGVTPGAVRGLLYRARSSLRSVAAAFTPQPLLNWACSVGGGSAGAGAAERLGQLTSAGGGAGLAGVLLKGAAAAVTAGVVATGAAAVAPVLQHIRQAPARELASADRGPAEGHSAALGEQRAATPPAPRIVRGGGARREVRRREVRRREVRASYSGARTVAPPYRVVVFERDSSGAARSSQPKRASAPASTNARPAGASPGELGGSSGTEGANSGKGRGVQDTRYGSEPSGAGRDGGSGSPSAREGADGGASDGNGGGSTGSAKGGDEGAAANGEATIASDGGSRGRGASGGATGSTGSTGSSDGRGDSASAEGEAGSEAARAHE